MFHYEKAKFNLAQVSMAVLTASKIVRILDM